MTDLIDPPGAAAGPAHAALDLSDVPVVDNHCHAIEASQAADVRSWRRYFTESPDESMRAHHAAHTAFYRRLIRAMSRHFGVACSEEAVLEARAARTTQELVSSMFSFQMTANVWVAGGNAYPRPSACRAEPLVFSQRREGRSSPTRPRTTAQKADYTKIQEILWNDLPVVPMYYPLMVQAVNNRVCGTEEGSVYILQTASKWWVTKTG